MIPIVSHVPKTIIIRGRSIDNTFHEIFTKPLPTAISLLQTRTCDETVATFGKADFVFRASEKSIITESGGISTSAAQFPKALGLRFEGNPNEKIRRPSPPFEGSSGGGRTVGVFSSNASDISQSS